jgi:hypothetical protein
MLASPFLPKYDHTRPAVSPIIGADDTCVVSITIVFILLFTQAFQ